MRIPPMNSRIKKDQSKLEKNKTVNDGRNAIDYHQENDLDLFYETAIYIVYMIYIDIAVKRYSFEHVHERGKKNSSGNL